MSNRRRRTKNRRVLTDEHVRMLREWKTFKDLCNEIGISTGHGSSVRNGYYHKTTSV